jgi:hypothetical protein
MIMTVQAISVGISQLVTRVGVATTSSNTSPGVANTFSKRAGSEVVGGSGGGAGGGGESTIGGWFMFSSAGVMTQHVGLMFQKFWVTVEYKPAINL